MKIMQGFLVVAAFVVTSTAAQAQYTFEYGGRTIRIDPDRGTVSIPGVYDNTGRRSKRARGDQDSSRKQAPEQAKIDPQPTTVAPAPTEQATAPAPAPAPAPAIASPQPSTATATVAPSETHYIDTTCGYRSRPPDPTGRCPCPEARAASSCRRGSARSAAPSCRARPGGQFAARRVADRREGRQGPDRAMRRQSLRLFGGRQIEQERRTGSDQYAPRQGCQMERADSRPQYRVDL
jgi:hypothetical protein